MTRGNVGNSGKKSKNKLTNSEKVPSVCSHTTVHEGRELRLVLNCRECGRPGPFADPRCLTPALEALCVEPGADTLVCSSHNETELQHPGMRVLAGLVGLAADLSSLSHRQPPPGQRECPSCHLRPGALFLQMRSALLDDCDTFVDALRGALEECAGRNAREMPCLQCIGDTAGDLAFLSESYGELAISAVHQAFRIVV